MKKLIGLLALSGLLASCGSTIVGSDVTLSSDYFVTNAQLDNGGTYSGPVICDDRYTNLAFSFNYLGATPYSVTATLEGSFGGTQKPNITDFDDTGSELTIYFTTPPVSAPLSLGGGLKAQSSGGLKAQAIIPTPKPLPNPVVIGSTRVNFTVNLQDGSSVPESTAFIPVVDNCDTAQ